MATRVNNNKKKNKNQITELIVKTYPNKIKNKSLLNKISSSRLKFIN